MANDLDQDRNAKLSQLGKEIREKAAAASQPAAPNITQVPNTPVATPPVIEPSVATVELKPEGAPSQPVVTTPPAEPKPKPTPAAELSTEPPAAPEPAEEPWDKGIFSTSIPDNSPLTLETIGSALKIEGLKTKDDLVAKYTGLETKVKELESSRETFFDTLPEDLREVVKVAQSKGDWKGALSTRVVDYSKVDPVALFENSIETDPAYRLADGSIDKAAVDAALAEIPHAMKRAYGNSLKEQLAQAQINRRNQIAQEAERKRNEQNTKLAEASKNIGNILPKDKFGITFEPKHADYLYSNIKSGSLVEKHLGKGFDITSVEPTKLLRTLALAEFGESISNHQRQQGVVQGKKELLHKAQNVQLGNNIIPPTPNQPEPKQATPAEKMAVMVNSKKGPGNSL